ncbi:TPA: transposase [Bacillus pseudomycoides]|nr:transposase [Bacillus pseudomycoides]
MQRRKHSIEFKQQAVQQITKTENKALVARRHNLSPNLVHKWVKTFQDHARQETGHHEVASSAEVK